MNGAMRKIYRRKLLSMKQNRIVYILLNETLDKLPENYRTVFMKSFFEGKTHTEIAEEMNLSVKSINRYKQKTMELLRNELKDYLPLLLLLFHRA